MKFQSIKYQNENGVFRVQLNRPDKLNAMNNRLINELLEILKIAANDPSIRVFVLSGEGRAFSAGVDLKETSASSFKDDTGILKVGNDIANFMSSMGVVTIAKVHGYCFTGALELALMFDMIFCTDDTQFGDTHAKWAIMPRWGMTQHLARRVGIAKAKELSFRAYRVKGLEAERIGLANRSFSSDTFDQEVETIISDILENSQQAIKAIKDLYNRGWATTLTEGLQIEQDADPNLSETAQMLNQFDEKKKQ